MCPAPSKQHKEISLCYATRCRESVPNLTMLQSDYISNGKSNGCTGGFTVIALPTRIKERQKKMFRQVRFISITPIKFFLVRKLKMHNNQLGFEIARIRKELKMTQIQLSQGICTQPTVSMIEKGEAQPGLEILIAISIKLKKPITHFINLLLMSNYTYVQVLIAELEELATNQRYDKVYAIVSKELYKKPEDYWFQAFLKWQYYISAYFLEKNTLEETLQELILLVQTTDNLILSREFLEDRIHNTIALLYSTRKDYRLALFYYDKINLGKNNSDTPRLNRDIYRLRVMYNKTKTLYDMGDYKKSVEHCKAGIKKSVELENMSFIGNFHYYTGQCYEKLNMDKDQIKDCYKNALFFFQLLDRKAYVEIIKKEKQIYL